MQPVLLLTICSLPLLASAAGLLGANQPCWDRKNELDAQKEAAGGVLPPGASYPSCDRLGRYAPQQCAGSECSCVDPTGEQLSSGDYRVKIWEQTQQACRCARSEYEVAQSGNVGVTVRCDVKGDYHHTQCEGSQCFCTNTHSGERLGEHLQGHVSKYAELVERCEAANAAQQ